MKKSTARRYGGLEDKLEAAEERLARYLAMSDDERNFLREMGVTRLSLDQERRKLKKLILKRDEKNNG